MTALKKPLFDHLKYALDRLATSDEALAHKIASYGYPRDRFMPAGFNSLARIIIGQQISRQVASHIWQKIEAKGWQDEHDFCHLTIEELKSCGLSTRKSEYLIGAASACVSGSLPLSSLHELDEEKVSEHLVSLRGIGHWTADNYRLFVLGHLDAWPGNDIALQEAMKRLRQLETRPSADDMNRLAADWAPYRGAGALMLWHIYAHEVRLATPSEI